MNKFYLSLLGLICCLLVHSVSAQDIFLKADALTVGASREKGYTNYAEISSLQFGISAESSWIRGGEPSVDNANFKKITITKNVDVSSTKFMQKIAFGVPIDLIEIVSTGSIGMNVREVLHKIELKDAYVTNFSTSGIQGCASGCPAIAESYEFIYRAIRVTTYVYDDKSRPTTSVFTYNVAENNSTF